MVYKYIMKRDELKKWRERNRYSQAQLARVLGVDVMTVSRWERGVREIPSFLHLALAYLESKGKEKQTQKNENGKGGNEYGSFSGMSYLPQKASCEK